MPHIEINFFPKHFLISINILIHANIMASLDYGWREKRMASSQKHTFTHTQHMEQHKRHQRNLGFISSSATDT